ncbi:MAG TPA: hypothetical protein VEK15_11235, partial [Vicinamibacteria bacterium]|nr:hypothetical protein [Vicinamibacteria bacterium]
MMCSNCPGLTNVEIDRTVRPFLARLAVGELTSVRAVAIEECGTEQPMLQIVRWIVSDSSVIAVEPSSPESAIVTALNPGRSRLVAERMLPEGGLGQVGLRDPFLELSQCTMLPELVFEIVPE